MKTLFSYKDIEVLSDDTSLIIRNSRICRKLDLSSGAPKTVSLTGADGKEFASADKDTADIAFIGMHNAVSDAKIKWYVTNISAEYISGSYKDSGHVKVSVFMDEPFSETKYRRDYLIYPDFPAISVENFISLEVQPMVFWTNRGNLNQARYFTNQRESVADSITCAENVRPALAVEFRGRTDTTNTLVVETQVKDQEFLNGNLLFCSDDTGAGFVFVQEAPPSGERRDLEDYDFKISGKRIDSCGWGIHPFEVHRNSSFKGYRHDLIVYSSEEEKHLLLKAFIRLRYPAKDLNIMVNPWGCGKFRQYVSEAFIIEEMKAAGEIGADFYQIDDQWQNESGLADLQIFNKRIREDFWTISKRHFNGTFDNVIAAAKKAGVKPALWIAPSLNCEYEDWEMIAGQILDFYKKYGFTNFKIDGVLIRSKKAEDNLRKLLEFVRDETDGKVYFNLDTTNGQRPGYWMFLEYGNIFLENRYCHYYHDCAVDYHPERTLRNLWDLSKYLTPSDLQIEIPSPDDINPAAYEKYPEARPDVYPLEYWAAIALFANPLIWTAPSKISAESRLVLKKMNDLHKKYREEFSHCDIFPVGARPDGKSVTGFIAWNKTSGKTFLLIFREKDCEETETTLILPHSSASSWQIISGRGTLTSTGKGVVSCALDKKQYIFAESI